MNAPDPDLCFALGQLCEEHGQIAVLDALSAACDAAADHEGATATAERLKKAGGSIRWARDEVRHACASGAPSLDQALTVLGDVSDDETGAKYTVDGAPTPLYGPGGFFAVNDLDAKERAAIRALKPGESVVGNEGAGGEWTLTRTS